jgi:hypothetical protein
MSEETVASRLRAFLSAGLTSTFAIAVATGISEKEMTLILGERIKPTEEQEQCLAKLLKNYSLATMLVNVGTMNARLRELTPQ